MGRTRLPRPDKFATAEEIQDRKQACEEYASWVNEPVEELFPEFKESPTLNDVATNRTLQAFLHNAITAHEAKHQLLLKEKLSPSPSAATYGIPQTGGTTGGSYTRK